MKKYLVLALIGIIVIGAILLFFLQNKKENNNNNLKETKLAIVTWVGYGPFFIAKEKGIFEKNGLIVNIINIEDTGARDSAIISGDIQFSISTLDTFANEACHGLPAKCILKLDDSYGSDGIVANKEIKTIKDLKGKKIAYDKGTTSHFFLMYLLRKEGFTTKDINSVYMTTGDAGAAFASNRVDAAVTWEPWLSKANETNFGHILLTSKDKPGLISDILIVNSKYVEKNPEVAQAIVKSWFEALEYLDQYHKESINIMAKGLNLSPQDFKAMLSGIKLADLNSNKEYFGIGIDKPGAFYELFNMAQKIWFAEKIVEKTLDPKSVVNVEFLQKLIN